MLDYFAQESLDVVRRAREASKRLDDREVTSGHLLLGLLAMERGPVRTVCDERNITEEAVEIALRSQIGAPQGTPRRGASIGQGAKMVIADARFHRSQPSMRLVLPAHMLMGIVTSATKIAGPKPPETYGYNALAMVYADPDSIEMAVKVAWADF